MICTNSIMQYVKMEIFILHCREFEDDLASPNEARAPTPKDSKVGIL